MVISNPYILGTVGAVVGIAAIHLADKYLFRQPFWRKEIMYPAEHHLASERVMKFVDIVAANHDLPDDGIVAELVKQDVPELDSELLVRFVPMAFTWIVLKKLGVATFPSSFIVFDSSNRPVEFPISNEHYFASALVIADNLMNCGFSDHVTRPTFEAITLRSAEMDAANKALAAGSKLVGSRILQPTLFGVLAENIASRG